VRDLGIDGRVIHSYMGSKGMDWIHLAQDRIYGRSGVTNLRAP